MPTTSQILGWTPEEVRAAAFTASGEAGGGNDLGGVLQTILARRALNPKSNVVSLVTAPQQFVANARYTTKQVTDPSFGQKFYGSRYNEALNTLENPSLMSGFLQTGQAATSFRGQSLLKHKHADDIMFDKSGNFYFDKHPGLAKQLIQTLGNPSPIGIAKGSQTASNAGQAPAPISADAFKNAYVAGLLESILQTPPMFAPWESKDQLAELNKPVDYFSQDSNNEDKFYGIHSLYGAGK